MGIGYVGGFGVPSCGASSLSVAVRGSVARKAALLMVCVSGWAADTALAVNPYASLPYASSVVQYTPGSLSSSDYSKPEVGLGVPERFTGEGQFPGVVTPFNPAYLANEIVSIGAGGSLTLGFDHPVVDDPANPFGVDLLLFGNAFFIDASYPRGVAAGVFGAPAGARVDVSADGQTWVSVGNPLGSGLFPTMGYSDVTSPYATVAGRVEADFLKPVNPSFNPIGKNYAQLLAGYAGSGGGAGIDLASTGLSSISFVRISSISGTVNIDAVSDVSPVPAPSVVGIAATFGFATLGRRRRSK
jgi:hypothetical protein